MKELSLIQSIVEQVIRQVRANNARTVQRIELELGRLYGDQWQHLEELWEPSTRNTPLEHAERILHFVPVDVICNDCATPYEKASRYEACSNCGGFNHALLEDSPLKVSALVLAE